MTGRYDKKAVAAALATLVVWASAFAGISQVVTKGGYGAGQTALLRFLVASATMAGVAIVRKQRLPRREDLPRLVGAALLGITIYHLAFTFGETQVSAGAAALIIASGPIWTALLAVAFLGERFNRWGWTGVALAFSGVSAISLGEGKGGLTIEPMALLVLLAAMSTAGYFVLSKKPLRHYSSIEFTSYVIWFGTVPMLVFLPGLIAQAQHAPAWSTWTVVYLGVLPGALAYVLWSYALARMPASTTASFLYATPVLATLMAWAWQGVVPSTVSLGGGALALVGVILVQTRGRPKSVIAVSIAATPEQRAAVREMVGELLGYFATRWEVDPAYYDDELAHFDEWYGGPRGRAFIATVDGAPAGSMVVRDLGGGIAEFRRMWVRPPFRRHGVARAILHAAEAEARTIGYARAQFMTSSELEGAIDLYRGEGYAQIPPYREVMSETILAFGKDM
jgi:drug/metabolite transporter (DMT)-like permease/GNAT superfamily N-acetyltransferase